MARRKAAESSDTEAYVFRYVEGDGRPRTPLTAVFNIRSVSKMPHARENHRHPMFIRGFDDFCISDRSAGLNDGCNTDFGCGIEAIAEREEGVRSHDTTFDR